MNLLLNPGMLLQCVMMFSAFQHAVSGTCLHEGTVYPEGSIPSSDPCKHITCDAEMGVYTFLEDCPERQWQMQWVCADPVRTKDKCCLSCPSQECRSNGITFQHGDSLPNRDCTQMCKCGRGFLIDCSPIVIPPCPPKGCFSAEDFLPFTKELRGCPKLQACSQCTSALQCEDGLVYRPLTSPCRATCENPNAENECNLLQTEGCVCPLRTILKGGTCIPYIDCVCNPNPCKNGGTCKAQLSSRGVLYICTCPYPYGGRDCQFKTHIADAYGDPEHDTFDGAWISFQGYNTYVLVQTKTGSSMQPFQIYATGEHLQWDRAESSTVVKSMVIKLYGQTVHIERQDDSSFEVKIGDEVIDAASYAFPQQFRIYEAGMSIYLETDSDITGMVLIASLSNKYSYLASVTISDNYAGEVEGIFGNCDGNENNDYVTSDGTYVSYGKDDLIGESWEIGNHTKRSNSSSAASAPACRNETKELVKGNTYCGLLTDVNGPFSSCLASGLLDTDHMYKACEKDICAYQDTLEEGRVLACSYLGALDLECGERGFPPQPWRNHSACEIKCPAGMTYKSSTNACPNTCENQYAEDECHLSDRERCACPDGEFQRNGSCVATCGPVCIAVAVDVSESIDDSAAKNEEADFLHALGEALTSSDRLSRYHLVLTYLPFNEGVLVNETRVIKTNDYTTRELFLSEEDANWNAIKEDIRNKETGKLTDMSALFNYVATGVDYCDGNVKGLIVVSDFIVTLNQDKVGSSLQTLQDLLYKVMAVGLSKERSEKGFREVGTASGISLDLREAGWESGPLQSAIASLLGDGST